MGKGGLSDHNNALKTGYDPAIGAWPDWIDQVIDPALLPEVSPVGTVLGQIDPHCADDLGLSHAVRVHAGTTDSIAAFLACAPLEPGTAVTSLGSTLAIKILSKVRIDDPNIGLYSHRIRDMWLVGGASNTGGAVLAEYFTPSKIAKLSTEMDPNAPTGLDYYPLKHPGERFPINDPNLPPRVKPRPESDVDFLQGLFEGIAAIEALCYQEIQARGGESPRKLLTAGGGADNAVFSAIRAHALNVVPQSTQATEAAIGAAYLTLNPN
jgi:sugar (pentulose or hexulose) kinase